MMGDSCNLPIIFYKKICIGKMEIKIWIYVEIEQDWDTINNIEEVVIEKILK